MSTSAAIRSEARELAKQPFSVDVSPGLATDGSVMYTAQVKEIPGCMADGRTRKEAGREVESALQAVLEYMLEAGLPIPTPRIRKRRAIHAAASVNGVHAGHQQTDPASKKVTQKRRKVAA